MKGAQLTMNGERLNDWRTQKKRVCVKNDIINAYESLFKTNFEFFFSESFIYNLMLKKDSILYEVCSHLEPTIKLDSYPPKMLFIRDFFEILLRFLYNLSMREWKN